MQPHIPHKTGRFNRHNLVPNSAAALVILDEECRIRSIIGAAARFSSETGDPVQYDQVYQAHPENGEATMKEVRVADAHRTTVIFRETPTTLRLEEHVGGGCWAQISIRKRGQTQNIPEVLIAPLDGDTWRATPAAVTAHPVPPLGEVWAFAPTVQNNAAVNPAPWQLLTSAAWAFANIKPESFPVVDVPLTPELAFITERESKMRAGRQVRRLQSMLQKLPPDVQREYLRQLAAAKA